MISWFQVFKQNAYEPTQIGKYCVSIAGAALFLGYYDGQNGAYSYNAMAVMDDYGNLVRVS